MDSLAPPATQRKKQTWKVCDDGCIRLSFPKGKIVVADAADLATLSRYCWYLDVSDAALYPRASLSAKNGWKHIRMHRLLMRPPKGKVVDHINRNTLDNRRSNLRVCTRGQNGANSKKRKSTSPFRGVHWASRDRRWVAQITTNGIVCGLGYYKDPKDAARAYNDAAIRFHGPFATLNNVE